MYTYILHIQYHKQTFTLLLVTSDSSVGTINDHSIPVRHWLRGWELLICRIKSKSLNKIYQEDLTSLTPAYFSKSMCHHPQSFVSATCGFLYSSMFQFLLLFVLCMCLILCWEDTFSLLPHRMRLILQDSAQKASQLWKHPSLSQSDLSLVLYIHFH